MDPFDSILNKIAVRGTDDAEKNSLLERYRAWLATADPDAARAVAARAAVRFVTSPRGLDGIDEQDTIALATLRCALTACVASIVPGDKVVRDAATEAAAKYDKIVGYIRSGTSNERSYSAGRTGVLVSFAACAACARDDHAEYALRAMYYEPRSTNAVSYAATDQDLFDVEEGSAELFKSSLWQGFEDDLLTGHMISGEYWSDAPKNWAFWEGWYGGMLAGQPLPWELQRDVALIDDEIWQAGPEAVAGKIAEIEAAYWAERLPQHETLSQDEDTGKFRVTAEPFDDAKAVERWLRQIDFALSLAVDSNTSDFNRMCTAFKYLNHTLENCRDDPNAIEQQVGIARGIIDTNLARDGYASDDSLEALSHVLEQIQVQMRADHPEVRKAWEKRIAQKLRETDRETKLAAAGAIRAEKERTLDRLNTEMELDAEAVETSDDPEVQAQAIRRAGGRAAKMSAMERTGKVIKRVDDSAGYKGVRIAGTGYTVGDILWMLGNLF